MDDRRAEGRPRRLLLMRKDAVAASFVWSPARGEVLEAEALSPRDLPFGCSDTTGAFRRSLLASWLDERAIPDLRPRILVNLKGLGLATTCELMCLGHGLGLSDQYWIKEPGSKDAWDEVNYFDNDFSPVLGELLLPHDADSAPRALAELVSSPELLASSPDSALNGNLPKRWEIDERGRRVLVKGSHPENRYQEPFNEHLVSLMCERLLDAGDALTYELHVNGYLRYTSRCACMVDGDTELVSAFQLHRSHRRRNDEGLCAFYERVCREHGLDVRRDVEKMLVVDYLSANFDRHWNNFGVLVDSDSRRFLRAAPLFDTGASFWCDRERPSVGGKIRLPQTTGERPFTRHVDEQVERYCDDLSWFDGDRLDGFVADIERTLSQNPIVANDGNRVDRICSGFERRLAEIERISASRSPNH